MYSLVQKFPLVFLFVMIALLVMGAWQLSGMLGMTIMGYMIIFAVALGFFLVYWATYGRSAGSPLRAAGPLLAIALAAAPFHLTGIGGATAALLFYLLLPGAGMIVALWELTMARREGR